MRCGYYFMKDLKKKGKENKKKKVNLKKKLFTIIKRSACVPLKTGTSICIRLV
jgi:hypothetical protein